MSYTHDYDRAKYSLSDGQSGYLKERDAAQRRAHFDHKKNVAYNNHRHDAIVVEAVERRKKRIKQSSIPPEERTVTFLHVGKAGGSDAVYGIREAARQVHSHCNWHFF